MNGSCFCGKIQYNILPPLKFIVHDHCSMCRKISGAAFVTWCGVKSEIDQFKLILGSEFLQTFKSSPEAERQFCKNCGTHLFFRSTKWQGELHFTRASVTSEMKEQPMSHVFFSNKVAWISVNDNLDKYGGVSGFEKLN